MNYSLIAKTIIRIEMQKRNINFMYLSEKLKVIGVDDIKIGKYLKNQGDKYEYCSYPTLH